MLDGWHWDLSIRVALLVALVVSVLFVRSRLNYRAIPKLSKRASEREPDCMVVIPARNEERSIAGAVRSFPHDTVIVVDDHSADQTAEAAREAGAGVIRARELPNGAVGKPNACLSGARVLTSKWILFADADTRFEAGFMDAAVSEAEARDLAFLSVYPRLEGETFSERLLAPFASALYFCGVRPRAGAVEIFNGQCILVRREAYEFVGGHAAVLNSVNEDMKLAALGARHRLKLGVARADEWGRVHFREPGRTIGRGALRFSRGAVGAGTVIMTAMISIALWLPVLIWLLMNGHRIAAAAFVLLPAAVTASWYLSARAFLAPLAIYWMAPIICNAAIRAITGRPVAWKGRVI